MKDIITILIGLLIGFATGTLGYAQVTTHIAPTDPQFSRREVIRRALGDEAADRQLPLTEAQRVEAIAILDRMQAGIDEFNASVHFKWSPSAPHQAAAVRVMAGSVRGSGTYIEEGGQTMVLTCRHVVSGVQSATVRFQNGKTATGDVLVDKDGRDIACVLINEPSVTPLKMATSAPSGKVEFLGFGPSNTQLRHWYGVVASIDERNGLANYSSGVAAGDSGGGVLNMNHEVVGVLTLGTTPNDPTEGHRTHQKSAGPYWAPVRNFVGRVCQRFRGGDCPPGGT